MSVLRSRKTGAGSAKDGREHENGLTSDGGESRIVPAGDVSLGHKPVQFPLGEKGVDEVETTENKGNRAEKESASVRRKVEDASSEGSSREVPEVGLPDLESVDKPEVLRVPVSVLVGPEGVGDSLERVDDGAGEVVGGVGEVLGSVVGNAEHQVQN